MFLAIRERCAAIPDCPVCRNLEHESHATISEQCQNRREKPPTFPFGIVFTSIRAKIGRLATCDDCDCRSDLDALVQPVKGSRNYPPISARDAFHAKSAFIFPAAPKDSPCRLRRGDHDHIHHWWEHRLVSGCSSSIGTGYRCRRHLETRQVRRRRPVFDENNTQFDRQFFGRTRDAGGRGGWNAHRAGDHPRSDHGPDPRPGNSAVLCRRGLGSDGDFGPSSRRNGGDG